MDYEWEREGEWDWDGWWVAGVRLFLAAIGKIKKFFQLIFLLFLFFFLFPPGTYSFLFSVSLSPLAEEFEKLVEINWIWWQELFERQQADAGR